MRTVASDAFAYSTGEGDKRPVSYSCLGVGSDVVAINDSERRVQPIPTGKRLSAGLGVACRTTSFCGENLALSRRTKGTHSHRGMR